MGPARFRQGIDQPRRTAAYVDDRHFRCQTRFTQQCQR